MRQILWALVAVWLALASIGLSAQVNCPVDDKTAVRVRTKPVKDPVTGRRLYIYKCVRGHVFYVVAK